MEAPASVAAFHRPLMIPVWHHATIKAGIKLAADKIFGEPTIGNTSAVVGIPLESLFLPEELVRKIGSEWSSMSISLPDTPPGGIVDTLPQGTTLILDKRQNNSNLFIRRTDGILPMYTTVLGINKYSGRSALQECPSNLSEEEVIAIMKAGLGMEGIGRRVDNPNDAGQLFKDIVIAHPTTERLQHDTAHHNWQEAGISVRAILARTHKEKLEWKRPKEKFTFQSTARVPLTLPGHGVINHDCTAEERFTYSFNQLYSRNEDDIIADLDIQFTSGQPLSYLAQRQYAHIAQETGPQKQDRAAQYITRTLALMMMQSAGEDEVAV